MTGEEAVRLVAMYFPQLHPIPENDAWWGQGFTDWVNVRKARPQFRGHYQPRVSLGERYYDQSQKATIEWQVDLAQRHGVHGFCHYHYWFGGKQLLETPTNIVMASKEIRFPFALAWANETWSRRWDGLDHHILIEQTHAPDRELWMRHFEYLFRAWSDDRAITVDGKPIFLIYRPHRITQVDAMLDLWREEARRRGLPGLFVIAMKQFEFPVPAVLKHFDGVMQFQPFEAFYSPDFEAGAPDRRAVQLARLLPERVQEMLRYLRNQLGSKLTYYDYDVVWQQVLKVEREAGLPTFPGAFVDWDNTARYVKRARIFKGASPESFAHWFGKQVEATAQRPPTERVIFLNAWNEWAEGAYLEPDERYGYRYLEAVRDALARWGTPARIAAD
ncbi:hypothetical protein DSM104443_02535 [Usitatibacter rugosus]|uniref:Glycosyl transferase n=1 Tax=Usitatibacter rugosus TaxID=2732067 RepID=A0A6M4GW46_9PROT|nr:glycoside hydrolase family 99-like domain-containing protein [Usitatibacter rugosus]QJR11459.1 hypothetical protein DSM104443_02535 [Usitatibacter rugosus]